MNVPIIFTLVRIALIPAVVLMFYLSPTWGHIAAAGLFTIAAITDWLDGYLARSLNQTTRFGAFLDPVADKLMITTVLVIIVGEMGVAYLAIPAAVIVGREIIISALREWMAEIGKRTSVKVGQIGKLKTAVQMIALIMLLLYSPAHTWWLKLSGIIFLYLAAVLTLWSMIMYLKAAWPDLTLAQEKE
ncbi:MAG: CDP-diacylglycerol--glycerol-3-phosphate 3-phosphatidyltransferase [Gammaproteobacteria bacterium]|nr:CDP-diacylglycerol--glycerol-3-phosphate 3-phosphatidyltransferase [Gammaproteobacteria bacterium]